MHAYEYAVIRVMPDVERGECLNAGVIVYSRSADFLAAEVALDETRLAALAPGLDAATVRRSLAAMADCTPIPGESIGQRFRWLTAPRSTVVQPAAVHTGITNDPAAALRHLMTRLVLPR